MPRTSRRIWRAQDCKRRNRLPEWWHALPEKADADTEVPLTRSESERRERFIRRMNEHFRRLETRDELCALGDVPPLETPDPNAPQVNAELTVVTHHQPQPRVAYTIAVDGSDQVTQTTPLKRGGNAKVVTYQGIIEAMADAVDRGVTRLIVYSDSQFHTSHVRARMKPNAIIASDRPELEALARRVLWLVRHFAHGVEFAHRPQHENPDAAAMNALLQRVETQEIHQ